MLSAYLRARRHAIATWALAVFFFPLCAWLYGLDASAYWYALSLYTLCLGCLAAFDMPRYLRRLRAAQIAAEHGAPGSLVLPEPRDELERAFQAAVRRMADIADARETELNEEHADRLAYYTMWLHQIKTPIAAIRLSRAQGDPVLEQELHSIERYVDMALTYARLSEMQGDLVLRSCRLRDVAAESLRRSATPFIYKRLTAKLDEFDDVVLSDEKWLGFIIEQLLSNAAKYTRKGGAHIYARDGALVVEDTGIGIRAEDLPRVFERGYTGLNGRIDRRASGLGLYMARRVADRLGISIEAQSEPDKGSRFILRFPDEAQTF